MTPDEDALRATAAGDQQPLTVVPPQPADHQLAHLNERRDRRRPLRDLAAVELCQLTDADKVSLCAYWASVAPAAFLLACEAFEQDTRW